MIICTVSLWAHFLFSECWRTSCEEVCPQVLIRYSTFWLKGEDWNWIIKEYKSWQGTGGLIDLRENLLKDWFPRYGLNLEKSARNNAAPQRQPAVVNSYCYSSCEDVLTLKGQGEKLLETERWIYLGGYLYSTHRMQTRGVNTLILSWCHPLAKS